MLLELRGMIYVGLGKSIATGRRIVWSEKLVSRTVKLVGTPFGLKKNSPAGGTSEFRSVIRGHDLELLHRIYAGTKVGVVVPVSGYFHSIQLDGVAKFALTVDREVDRVAALPMHYAGDQEHQVRKVPSEQRHVSNIGGSNDLAGGSALCLHQRHQIAG